MTNRFPAQTDDIFFQMTDLDKGTYGQTYIVSLFLHNQSREKRTVRISMYSYSVFYTGQKVWSLNSYLLAFKSWITVKKCVFKNPIKVCVSCFWRCPGTSAPSVAPHLTVSLFLWVPEPTHEASRGPLKGAVTAQKRPSKSPCWEGQKRIAFPRLGVIDLLSRKINDFDQKKKQ